MKMIQDLEDVLWLLVDGVGKLNLAVSIHGVLWWCCSQSLVGVLVSRQSDISGHWFRNVGALQTLGFVPGIDNESLVDVDLRSRVDKAFVVLCFTGVTLNNGLR